MPNSSYIARSKKNKHRYNVFDGNRWRIIDTSESTGTGVLAGLFGAIETASPLLGLGALLIAPSLVDALPTGIDVIEGNASITATPNYLEINSSSPHNIINYQAFNIAEREHVHFQLPGRTSSVLNRVTGQDPSQIMGQLSSNGQVLLINPNGVLFGAGSSVNVAGLMASTLSITNQNYLNGYLALEHDLNKPTAAVTNAGNITVNPKGYAVLAGGAISNTGAIETPQGNSTLVVGEKVLVQVNSSLGLEVEVSESLKSTVEGLNEAIKNAGSIKADGGVVKLAAAVENNLYAGLVNNTGIIEANGFVEKNGQIIITGSSAGLGQVVNTGTLDVSGDNGGSIHFEGDLVLNTGDFKALGQLGAGGRIEILGDNVVVAGHGALDASGHSSGGQILIGGAYQGKGATRTADYTYVGTDVTLNADAISRGNGGEIVVWSDIATRYYGQLSAQGGQASGNGGLAEVSGKEQLYFYGGANLLAPHGQRGSLLLDPQNLYVMSPNLWLDASQISGVNNGDHVATWLDASGNGYNVSQGNAANQPTYLNNGINGLPMLSFDGNDFLQNVSYVGPTDGSSAFLVANVTTSGLYGLFEVSNGTNYNTGLSQFNWGGTYYSRVVAGGSSDITTPNLTPGNVLYSTIFNGANKTHSTVINGTQVNQVSTVSGTYSNVLDVLDVGGIYNDFRMTGGIGELVLFNRALDATEQQLMNQYLGNKYGIIVPSASNTSVMTQSQIETLSQTANVSITADNNITFGALNNNVLNIQGNASLSIVAGGSVSMRDVTDELRTEGGGINITAASLTLGNLSTRGLSGSKFGDIILTANSDSISTAAIYTGGGNLTQNFVGNTTLNASNVVNTHGGMAQFAATGALTFTSHSGLSLNGGTLALVADSEGDGTGTLTINGAVTNTNANITLEGAQIDINNTVNAGTGSVMIRPNSAKAIRLVGSTDNADDATYLDISAAELDRIIAGTLSIGDAALASNISLVSDLDVSGVTGTAGVYNLAFNTAGSFTNTGYTINLGRDSLYFDGTNDYVKVPINSPETNYSYELWFNTTDPSASLSSVREPDLGGNHDRNLTLSSGNIAHRIWTGGTINSSGQNYADGKWHQVVVTVASGVGQKIYVDGSLVASGAPAFSNFNWDTTLDIGYGNDFTGVKLIDNINLYNRVFTLSDVQTQYNNGIGRSLTSSESGLVAGFDFNEGTGATGSDLSNNGYTATLMNGTVWVTGKNLTINATGTVNTGKIVGENADISIVSASNLTADGVVGSSGNGTVNLSANNNLVASSAVITDSGALSLLADADGNGSGNLTIDSTVTSSNANITLEGSQVDINSTIDAATGIVTIRPNNAKAIRLAGSTDNADDGTYLDISAAELDRIIAGTVSVGDAALASTISLADDLDVSGTVGTAGVYNLAFNSASGFTIAADRSIQTSDRDLTINTAGLTLNGDIDTGLGDLSVYSAGGSITLNDSSSIATHNGILQITSGFGAQLSLNSGSIIAANNLTLQTDSTFGSMNLNTGSIINAAGDVLLRTTGFSGNINLSNTLSANNLDLLTTTGQVYFSAPTLTINGNTTAETNGYNIYINTSTLDLDNLTLTNTGSGSVQIDSALSGNNLVFNAYTLTVNAPITLPGSSYILETLGGITLNNGGSISLPGGDLTVKTHSSAFGAQITLNSGSSVSADNITLQTDNAFGQISLNAGSSINATEDVLIQTTGFSPRINLGNTTTAGRNLTIASPTLLSTNAGLSADSDANGTGLLTINSTVSTSNYNLTLEGAQIDINDTINAGTGTVTIRPNNAKAIRLAGSTDNADDATYLDISNAELDRIIAGTVSIGDAALASNISLAGDLDVSGVTGAAGVYNLAFNTAGNFANTGHTINLGRDALYFDGSNDWISASGSMLLGNAGTISVWVKTSALNMVYNTHSGGWNQNTLSTGSLRIANGSPQTDVTFDPSSAQDNDWHLVTTTWQQGGERAVWIDGNKVGSQTGTASFVPGGNFELGYVSWMGGFYSGLMDDFQLYDRALNNTEIGNIYTSGSALASNAISGLTTRWRFNEGSGITASDVSGNGNTGTLTNGPTWVFGKDLNINATGTVNTGSLIGEGSSISVSSGTNLTVDNILASTGNGTVNLSSNNNLVVNSAVITDTGALSLLADADNNGSGALTIDADITSDTGEIILKSGADLTLNSGAAISSLATGNAIVLASTHGSIVNNAGAGALSATNGRWLAYSDHPDDTVEGGLSYSKLYNRTYAGNIPSSISGSANTFLYSVAPVLTITADNKSRDYGSNNPAWTGNITGYIDGDTSAILSGSASYTGTATSSSNANTYMITAGVGTLSNALGYTYNFVDGTLTIDPVALTVTVQNANKNYGDTNPSFGVDYSGFVLSQDESALGGSLSYNTSADVSSNVGDYTVSASGLTSGNYDISYVDGTLTIDPAALTVTVQNTNKNYGETNPSFGVDYSGFVLGQDESALGGSLSYSTAANNNSIVGDYTVSASGLTSGNYDISYVDGTLTIDPAALTVTVQNTNKNYGETNPSFGVDYSGFVLGQDESALGGSLSYNTAANANSSVGDYTVSASGLTSGNYDISYVDGTLTIDPATLTVTVQNANKNYGDTNPSFGVNYGGFVLGQDESALGGSLSYSTAANTNSNAGSYAVSASGLTSGNYDISYVDGTLTVTAATLTVTVQNANKVSGNANPLFTSLLTGFKNTDTVSSLGGSLLYTTLATTNSPAGSYLVSASGLVSTNYTFNYVNGYLSVAAATVVDPPYLLNPVQSTGNLGIEHFDSINMLKNVTPETNFNLDTLISISQSFLIPELPARQKIRHLKLESGDLFIK